VTWHEKHKGQLFCDQSSDAVIDVLKSECDAGNIAWRRPLAVELVRHADSDGFTLDTRSGPIRARALVIATGGLSIPKIGATDFGYRIAKQFGHKLIDTRPALVPLTFAPADWQPFAELSGVSLEVHLATGVKKAGGEFVEDLLLTHRGLSGPGVLQISSYWQPGEPVHVNLLPEQDAVAALLDAKNATKRQIGNLLAEWVPARLAHVWLQTHGVPADARLADLPDKSLRRVGEALSRWSLTPNGTEGYKKAEVTRGGVDTRELSSATMMSARVPGLYFIGEAVDVTGWLGGYNFQWAWASGVAAGQAAAEFAAIG
jgi:predicted Rossmann fold flavoprotein